MTEQLEPKQTAEDIYDGSVFYDADIPDNWLQLQATPSDDGKSVEFAFTSCVSTCLEGELVSHLDETIQSIVILDQVSAVKLCYQIMSGLDHINKFNQSNQQK